MMNQEDQISKEAHVCAALGVLFWLTVSAIFHLWWIFVPTAMFAVPATICNLVAFRRFRMQRLATLVLAVLVSFTVSAQAQTAEQIVQYTMVMDGHSLTAEQMAILKLRPIRIDAPTQVYTFDSATKKIVATTLQPGDTIAISADSSTAYWVGTRTEFVVISPAEFEARIQLAETRGFALTILAVMILFVLGFTAYRYQEQIPEFFRRRSVVKTEDHQH